MKLLNIDPLMRSIFIGDIGLNRNGGTNGRKLNQARYIPSSLNPTTKILDVTKWIQLIETGAVKKSAADGDIAGFVSNGLIQILSVGDNVVRTFTKTVTGSPVTAASTLINDLGFGRPVLITGLTVVLNTAVDPAKTLRFQFYKNNVLKATNFDVVNGDGATPPLIDVSAMAGGNDYSYSDLLDLRLASVAGSDTVGITSIKITITYELVD